MLRLYAPVALFLLCLDPAVGATLTGRILDSKTGEAVAKAEIIVMGSALRTVSDANGAFVLTVPGDQVELYVTSIGYGLIRQVVRIGEASTVTVDIALPQDTAVRKDSVTVTAGAFDAREPNPATVKNLSKLEMQALSMVLIGDPLRAAQALPGVTSSNDFRAEFAVRGAGYDRVAVYVDGVLTDSFVHSANLGHGGTRSTEKVSLSVINSDNVSEISLYPGAFPARFGDSSAAVLDIETRDGNFVKPAGRFATGLITTSGVVDGPFARHKGSWLLSGRTSFADYLQRFIERITGTGREPGETRSDLNFSDAQAKVAYVLTPKHQVGVSGIYGILTASQDLTPGATGTEELKRLTSENSLVNSFWRYTPGPHFTLQSRVFSLRDHAREKNRNDGLLNDTRRTQAGFRSDAVYGWGAQTIEAGVYVRFQSARRLANGFSGTDPFSPRKLEDFDEHAAEDSYYLEDTWKTRHTALTIGGRIAHSDLTGQAIASPRAAFTWGPSENWTVRTGAGTYSQFPDFEQVFGFFGNRKLRAARANLFNASVERRIGTQTRVLLEAYDREDRQLPFSFYEPLLVNGQGTAYGLPYRNVLQGYARGAEISLQRRSANGLTGWVSYGWSTTNYTDATDHLLFRSDFDQRHAITAFGSYRIRPTFDVSSQWRYGSGVPIPGFIHREGYISSLASERNTSRLPAYSRWDVRANKAFLFPKWKLTVSAEVLNVLRHINFILVSTDPVRIYSTGRYSANLDTSFGILPTVAISVAF